MGLTYQNNIPFGGSSNSADRIKYSDTQNVKKKIDEVASVVDEVKEKLTWKFYTSTSITTISLPDSFNELHVKVHDETTDIGVVFNFIPSDFEVSTYFRQGYYTDNSVNAEITLLATPTSIKLDAFNLNGSEITDRSTMTIHYR